MILSRLIASLTWRSALSICTTIAVLLLPSGLSAFAIKLEHFVHQEITFDGLNPLEPNPQLGITAPKFELILDTGVKVKFSVASINEVVFHNVATDDLQGPLVTRLHFDSEDLAGGSDRLVRLRQQIVFNLADAAFLDFSNPGATAEREVRVTSSRALLGRALHTLQDFYAHTNWVERHNLSLTEIDTRLGNAIVPSPSPGASCDSSEPELASLTSGWFLDDPELAYCGAPENKCAHGAIGCGIHKDVNLRTGFESAKALAIKATNTYTQETLQAVLAGYTLLVPALGEAGAKQAVRLAVCEFMGVPDAFSTCLTSHTLTVQKVNAGGGTTLEGLVQSTSGNITPAIDCGQLCAGNAVAGTAIQLIASDTPPWIFMGWRQGGACAGSTTRSCTVDLTSNKTAIAVFAETEPLPLPFMGYQHSCVLEIYATQKSCSQPPTAEPGYLAFHEELSADYGGTPQSGGGYASIMVDGQISLTPGQSSMSAVVDADAVGQWFSRGSQYMSAVYGNDIKVVSNTLPHGTPVTVRVTLQVSLQHSLEVELSEPPLVQWFATAPAFRAVAEVGFIPRTVWLDGVSTSQSVDYTVTSFVGSSIPVTSSLILNTNTIQASRASVLVTLSGSISGPFLAEVNGLDVQFIQN